MADLTLRIRVAELIEQHGSLRAAARVLECDHGYLSRLASGDKDDPGPILLRRMKLRRIVTYERTTVCDDCAGTGVYSDGLPCDTCKAGSGVPLGWLYDWTHSSALGKPDEHFTSFTTDEAYARKHDNVRPVFAHYSGVPRCVKCGGAKVPLLPHHTGACDCIEEDGFDIAAREYLAAKDTK